MFFRYTHTQTILTLKKIMNKTYFICQIAWLNYKTVNWIKCSVLAVHFMLSLWLSFVVVVVIIQCNKICVCFFFFGQRPTIRLPKTDIFMHTNIHNAQIWMHMQCTTSNKIIPNTNIDTWNAKSSWNTKIIRR